MKIYMVECTDYVNADLSRKFFVSSKRVAERIARRFSGHGDGFVADVAEINFTATKKGWLEILNVYGSFTPN